MTLQERISLMIDNPSAEIDLQWIEQLYEKYPYFSLPASLMLKQGKELSADEKSKYMSRLALNASDRDALALLINDKDGNWTHFYPQVPKHEAVTTEKAIDTFLDTYGNSNPKENALLERLIFNPTPDYAQLLAEEEGHSVPQGGELEGDSQDALINAFIVKSREQQGHYPAINEELALDTKNTQEEQHDQSPVSAPESSADDSMLSESLAKIYIKQHKYSKAYEIIRNLSLNFPEKSIYFADQLRFLQKLMINQRYIQSKK